MTRSWEDSEPITEIDISRVKIQPATYRDYFVVKNALFGINDGLCSSNPHNYNAPMESWGNPSYSSFGVYYRQFRAHQRVKIPVKDEVLHCFFGVNLIFLMTLPHSGTMSNKPLQMETPTIFAHTILKFQTLSNEDLVGRYPMASQAKFANQDRSCRDRLIMAHVPDKNDVESHYPEQSTRGLEFRKGVNYMSRIGAKYEVLLPFFEHKFDSH